MSVRLRKWKNKEGKIEEHWMVDVMVTIPGEGDKRVRDSSPVNTRRGAEQHERQIRQALLDGTFGKAKAQNSIPTLAAFEKRFIEYSENNNKPSTVAAKKQLLKDHIIPAFGSKRLDQIGPAEIEAFKARMRKTRSRACARKPEATKWAIKKRKQREPPALSAKSINNALTVLRKLLVVAQDQGEIAHLPRLRFFKPEKPVHDFLSFEEAERLIEAADSEWRTLILTAVRTGLRRGELIGLQWSDLDLAREFLHVRRTIWKGNIGTPKGGRSRIVDMPPSVVKALKALRHLKGPYVFCREDGAPFTPGHLKHPLTRALRRAGISREHGQIGWHDLRHTYGSHLAMRGVPIKVIQELMGHATLEMTLKYAHLSPETKRAAVQVLDEPAPAAPSVSAETAHTRHIDEAAR
jgi:integrase